MSTLPSVTYRLEQCPKCGYSLAGLPATHACPECGFGYETGMFQLHGWSFAGIGLSRRTISRGGGVLILAAGISPLLGFGWPWGTALLLAAIIGLTVGALYLLVWRAELSGRAHLGSYLITKDGIVTGTGRLLPWTAYSHMVLLQEGGDAWRIHISPGILQAVQRIPIINVAFRGSFSEAEALSSELQRRMNEARDRT